ncbi:UbiA prenyltransferase family protein, partial [Fibrobacterota bacterium]
CSYSLGLKREVILDVFIIAMGFLLRVSAGAVAVGAVFSPWLLACTFFLSLFLALNKRRHEIDLLKDDAPEHRAVLAFYSTYLLDQMIAVTTASSVLCYTMYTMSAATISRHGTSYLVVTVPFVVYGIFRYLYLVHKKKKGGAPEKVLVTDAPLALNIIAWAGTSTLIINL